MANSNAPAGLKAVRDLRGAPYNSGGNLYFVPATDNTAIFIGDPVKSAGSADPITGVPTVAQAAAGDTIRGVVMGVIPDTAQSSIYRAASTARYLLVCDNDDIEFEVQEDAIGGALGVADVGLNADLIIGAGNTFTGRSGVQLDSSTKATASLQVRILGFVQRVDNEIGVANAKIRVMINKHELKATAGV